MQCRAPTGAGTPTGGKLVYDNERRSTHWQNAQTSPSCTDDFAYDGEGTRVAQVGQRVDHDLLPQRTRRGDRLDPPRVLRRARAGDLCPRRQWAAPPLLPGDRRSRQRLRGAERLRQRRAQLFAPYGGARYVSGAMPTAIGFTGQRADATSGLDLLRRTVLRPDPWPVHMRRQLRGGRPAAQRLRLRRRQGRDGDRSERTFHGCSRLEELYSQRETQAKPEGPNASNGDDPTRDGGGISIDPRPAGKRSHRAVRVGCGRYQAVATWFDTSISGLINNIRFGNRAPASGAALQTESALIAAQSTIGPDELYRASQADFGAVYYGPSKTRPDDRRRWAEGWHGDLLRRPRHADRRRGSRGAA